MPMFSWVQNKLFNGRSSRSKKPSSISPPTGQPLTSREEFSDWPSALLAIGTFGLKSIKDGTLQQPGNHPDSEQTTADAQDDEAQHTHTTTTTGTIITTPTPMMVQIKDSGPSDTAAVVAKKSLSSYLLNKFFACGGGGFAVPSGSPLVRDPLPHSESRMEKILRKILDKKVHPQGPYGAAASATKYLKGSTDDDDDDDEDHHQKPIQYISKWVKTDTDYIVLEV